MPHKPAWGDKLALHWYDCGAAGVRPVKITEASVNGRFFPMKFTFTAARDRHRRRRLRFIRLAEDIRLQRGRRSGAGLVPHLGGFTEGSALTGGANDAAFVIAFGPLRRMPAMAH